MAKVIFKPDDSSPSSSGGGSDEEVWGTIAYTVSIIIAAFVFVPQDGWIWGLVKAFFWWVVLLVKLFKWIF